MKIIELEKLMCKYGKEARLIDVVNALKKERANHPCLKCKDTCPYNRGFKAVTVGGK